MYDAPAITNDQAALAQKALQDEIKAAIEFFANDLGLSWAAAMHGRKMDALMEQVAYWQSVERPGYVIDTLRWMLANRDRPECARYMERLSHHPKYLAPMKNSHSTLEDIHEMMLDSQPIEQVAGGVVRVLNEAEACDAWAEMIVAAPAYSEYASRALGGLCAAEKMADGRTRFSFFHAWADSDDVEALKLGSESYPGLAGFEFVVKMPIKTREIGLGSISSVKTTRHTSDAS